MYTLEGVSSVENFISAYLKTSLQLIKSLNKTEISIFYQPFQFLFYHSAAGVSVV